MVLGWLLIWAGIIVFWTIVWGAMGTHLFVRFIACYFAIGLVVGITSDLVRSFRFYWLAVRQPRTIPIGSGAARFYVIRDENGSGREIVIEHDG